MIKSGDACLATCEKCSKQFCTTCIKDGTCPSCVKEKTPEKQGEFRMNPNKQFRAERAQPAPTPAPVPAASPRPPPATPDPSPKASWLTRAGKSEKRVVRERPSVPPLRFSPLAWAKLVWFCLHGGDRDWRALPSPTRAIRSML